MAKNETKKNYNKTETIMRRMAREVKYRGAAKVTRSGRKVNEIRGAW